MMDTKTFEIIDKYLNHELNEKELRDFQKWLENDPDLKKDIELHKEINKAILEKDVMGLRAKIQKIHKEEMKVVADKRRKTITLFTSKTYVRTGIAAAITIALIITGVFLFNNNKDLDQNTVFSEYYQPEEAITIVRSGDATNNQTLREAMLAYQKNDYQTAIELFQKNPNNNLAKFYLGLSYLETSKIEDAKNLFQQIIEHNDNLFIESANWYLGLCHLKLQDTEKAKETFSRISKSNSIYQDKARQILKYL